jgi:2-polyprenyl-3-methyl-5-hydroxy-6-metoxy-1,4-benzoquinol methylase
MINFQRFKKHLEILEKDIYGQPADAGHSQWALDSLALMEGESAEIKSVLDVGCGQGFMRPVFEGIGMSWSGCALGEDFEVMKKNQDGEIY